MSSDNGISQQGSEEEEDDGVVVLQDAEGNEFEFGFLGIVDHEDEAYALLAPLEQLEDEDDEGEFDVFIYGYEEAEDGSEVFTEIDDPKLFDAVTEVAKAYLEGLTDDDDDEGGDEAVEDAATD